MDDDPIFFLFPFPHLFHSFVSDFVRARDPDLFLSIRMNDDFLLLVFPVPHQFHPLVSDVGHTRDPVLFPLILGEDDLNLVYLVPQHIFLDSNQIVLQMKKKF